MKLAEETFYDESSAIFIAKKICSVMIFADPLFCFYFIFFTAVDSISLIRFSWFTSEAPGS